MKGPNDRDDAPPGGRESLDKSETRASITGKASETTVDAGKYFYGIVSCGERRLGWAGIDDKEVYTIPFRDVAAIVSDASSLVYDVNERNVRRHEDTLRKLMETYTVVPAEFGTVFYNAQILRNAMERAYGAARECLRVLEGTVELGVKVLLEKGVSIDKGCMKSLHDEIAETLKRKAVQSVSGELFSERLLLNESFLVKRAAMDDFSEEVTRLAEKYPMLKFMYSGPWPPHNFVHMHIGKKDIAIRRGEVKTK
jgi:hypothetical protein